MCVTVTPRERIRFRSCCAHPSIHSSVDSSSPLLCSVPPPNQLAPRVQRSSAHEKEAMDDPFVEAYDASELEIAAEFLTNWLPFLTRGLCDPCSDSIRRRVLCLRPGRTEDPSGDEAEESRNTGGPSTDGCDHIQPGGWGTDPEAPSEEKDRIEPTGWGTEPEASASPREGKVRMSWADMAQEDELEETVAEEEAWRDSKVGERVDEGEKVKKKGTELSREQREYIRFMNVGRKKDFICLERINKKIVNILDGLELHTGVFSTAEQKRIVDFVYELQEKGRNGQLRERTYSEPQKWMRGKGRVTIQFGCCYNYAMDNNGNPPGILRNVVADPIPPLFKVIIRRLVRWHVLPTSCIPDSCIVNIYEPGDCIPPHIDNHDFVRPFTTVSFLSECNILFGSNLKVEGAGEFSGLVAIPLPVGSVLVLNGNAADVAKHCVPAVPTKRMSITFRRMDENMWPFGFSPEPDLQNIQPLPYDSTAKGLPGLVTNGQPQQSRNRGPAARRRGSKKGKELVGKPVGIDHSLDSHDNSPLLPTPDITPKRLPHQLVNKSRATGSNSMDRRKELNGRSPESKQMPNLHPRYGTEHHVRQLSRWDMQVEADGRSIDREGSSEPTGRKVRMEQNRIVIIRNI